MSEALKPGESNVPTSVTNISDFSDNESELESFDPMPYAFILKDVHRKMLKLSPEKLYNSRISCPPLHVLVDHLLAVLWCFYSGKGHDRLGSAQLHWAIKFLEGLRDRNNRQTADVRMAIDDLEEALVERGSEVDEEEVSKRQYEDDRDRNLDYSTPNYEDFMISLIARVAQSEKQPEPEAGEGPAIVDKSIPPGPSSVRAAFQLPEIRIETPSIILNDMLAEDKETMRELLETSVANPGASSSPIKEQSDAQTSLLRDNAADVKNNLLQRIIKDLENLKAIDETLRNLKSDSNSQLAGKLKNLMDDMANK